MADVRRPQKRRVVHLARNLLQGGVGGLFAGGITGLVEAVVLQVGPGAPDTWSPLVAVAAYGLVGVVFGVGLGLVATLAERVAHISESRAWGLGFAGAVTPLLLLVLSGTAVHGGPALLGLGATLAVIVLVDLVAIFLLPPVIEHNAPFLLQGKGLVLCGGGALVLTTVAALIPGSDPRDVVHDQAAPAAVAAAPDVVVLVVDSLRADQQGSALDALAADGIAFEQAHASASSTRTSTASLLTSRIPSGHGVFDQDASLSPALPTLAEVLGEAGVITAAFVDGTELDRGFDQGFDTFVAEAPTHPFGAPHSVSALALYRALRVGWTRLRGPDPVVEHHYQPAEVVLADVRAFLERHPEGCVFVLAHLMDPHAPWFGESGEVGSAAEGFDQMAGRYRAEVARVDRELVGFLGWLEDEGRYRDTLVVLVGNHGTELGEHGGLGAGSTLYDEQLHVPLLVKLPGDERAGTVVPWQVRLIDVAPTVVGALGLEPHPSWEGRDLLADLVEVDREAAEAAEREAAEASELDEAEEAEVAVDEDSEEAEPTEVVPTPEQCEAARSHVRDRVVVAEQDHRGHRLRAIRAGGFKLVEAEAGNPRGLPPVALFDLVEDPAEAQVLDRDSPEVCGTSQQARSAHLSEQLDRVVQAASSARPGASSLTATECENLRQLGYLDPDDPCGEPAGP